MKKIILFLTLALFSAPMTNAFAFGSLQPAAASFLLNVSTPNVMADETETPAPGLELPSPDIGVVIGDVLKNYKSMTPLGWGMAIVMILTWAIGFLTDGQWKRLIVTLLSISYSVILGLSNGMSWSAVIIAALITGGGAVALYEAIKGVVKAVKS